MAKIGTLQINVLANTGTLEAGMARAQSAVSAGSAAMTRSLTSMADRAARDAAKMARDMASVGDSFGPSTKVFETNLKQMEGNFRASMAKIKEIANVAVAMPNLDPSNFDLGANAMRAQAAEAQRYAQAMELVQKELEATAVANNNATSAYGISLKAAQAATAEARLSAEGIRAQADQLEELGKKLRSSAEGQKLFAGGQKAVTEASGSMRAGMQQLAYNIGDISTGLATGQRPMMIFAQQSGQVIQALQLMNTKTTGLLGTLAGPWGLIMSSAVVALVPLISNMEIFNDKVGDAVKALREKAAADDIARQAQAQYDSTLPGLIEREKKLTDELQKQISARKDLAALNRFEAENQKAAATFEVEWRRKNLAASQKDSDLKAKMLTAPTVGDGPNMAVFAYQDAQKKVEADRKAMFDAQQAVWVADNNLRRAALQDLQSRVLGSKSSKAQAAFDKTKASADARYMAFDYNDAEYSAVAGAAQAALDAAQKQPKKAKASPLKDHDYRFTQTMADLDDRILRAREQLAADTEDEATQALNRVKNEAAKRASTIAHDKGLTAAEKKIAEDRNKLALSLDTQVLERQAQQKAANDAYNLQRAANDNQRDLLQAQLQIAATAKDRRTIQLRLLDLERRDEEATARKVLATSKDAAQRQEAQKRLDALPDKYAARRTGVENSTMGPAEAYLKQLKDAAAATDEALQQVAVNGLQSLNDGIVDAIMNAKSLGDMFSNVAKQIVADLLRIAVQRAIIAPLADLVFGSKKSGGGSSSTGNDLFDSFLSVAPSVFVPAFADGTNSAPSGVALVGERGPELVRFRGGEQVIPNDRLRLSNGGGTVINNWNGVMTVEDFWNEINARDQAAANAGAERGITRLGTMRRRSLAG